ncbi:hypothetical protein [Aneurinibacillus tyrosinisolvens]|uniref:hypothetical protein n=1 Tax=Aneurinibacillus tyrosinisolvens TaxID=1443435 RepID=UPI000AD68CCB|nr:hypothetical protein [Aneurinibacillus tyrosinisolvens]
MRRAIGGLKNRKNFLNALFVLGFLGLILTSVTVQPMIGVVVALALFVSSVFAWT